MEKIKKYLLAQADKMTAWIGFIGVLLLLAGMHSLLIVLFVALIALPESQFSEIFKAWTKKIKDIDGK